MPVRHWVDGNLTGPEAQKVADQLKANRRFLTDEEYGASLYTLVIGCVDVALIHTSRRFSVLLGYRTNEPWKNRWMLIGGRMNIGESFGDTAKRHMMKNAGLVLDPDRFKFIRTDSYLWSCRQQPPAGHGCHMVGSTVFARITDEEYSLIKPGDDVSELKWMDCADAVLEKEIHPAHRAAIEDFLSGRFDR